MLQLLSCKQVKQDTIPVIGTTISDPLTVYFASLARRWNLEKVLGYPTFQPSNLHATYDLIPRSTVHLALVKYGT